MATVAEVRTLLDTLETASSRSADLVAQIAVTEANLARLRAELEQFSIEQAEADLKAAVARLDVAGAKA